MSGGGTEIIMQILLYILSAVIPYLIGGINPAIVLSKLIYHKDIRDMGSKNPGFTNFKRVFGGRYAFLVFLFDILKSAIVCLAFGYAFSKCGLIYQVGAAYAGFFAMLGHCFPVWYKFKGGKAFLAGAAAIWCIDWRAGLVAMCIMIVLLFTVHYMSLASICAGISCPITLAVCGVESPFVIVLCTASALLMICRHSANIKRLISGAETKFYLFGYRDGKSA